MNSVSVSMALGLVLYVTAFFLPAVSQLAGWQCAWVVASTMFGLPTSRGQLLTTLIGLYNPAIVLLVVSTAVGRWKALRGALSGVILVALAATWTFLFVTEPHPVAIGHMLWVAGGLLLVAPEISAWRISLGRQAQ